jgi:hypothetical protein
MHLLAEQFVSWRWWLGFSKNGDQEQSNGTNFASYLANFLSVFTSVVYGEFCRSKKETDKQKKFFDNHLIFCWNRLLSEGKLNCWCRRKMKLGPTVASDDSNCAWRSVQKAPTLRAGRRSYTFQLSVSGQGASCQVQSTSTAVELRRISETRAPWGTQVLIR